MITKEQYKRLCEAVDRPTHDGIDPFLVGDLLESFEELYIALDEACLKNRPTYAAFKLVCDEEGFDRLPIKRKR